MNKRRGVEAIGYRLSARTSVRQLLADSRQPTADSRTKQAFTHCLRVQAVVAVVALAGCYDSEAMVQRVRDDSVRTQHAEIDLGDFFVTLPCDKQTGAVSEIAVHYFGNVPRYRAAQVRQQIASDEYRLRHDTLLALRHTTHEELAEAKLSTLKARLLSVANGVLKDAPVESVGFYEIRQVPR